MEITPFLTGADVAMVAVTMLLVQGLKFLLPSPIPADPKIPVSRWDVAEWLKWAPYIAAFLFGVALSIAFDPHEGQALKGKIRDGLQTGAYAVAAWEGYSQTIKKIVDRIRASG